MNLVCEKLDITMFNYQSIFVQTYRTQKTVFKGAFGAHRNCDCQFPGMLPPVGLPRAYGVLGFKK